MQINLTNQLHLLIIGNEVIVMFGQYLKKLCSSLFFLVIFFLFLIVVDFLWAQLITALHLNLGLNWNAVIIVIITLLIELLAVYVIRIDSRDSQEEYKRIYKNGSVPFSYDFWNTFTSRDNIIHTIAFNTLLLPFILMIGIGNKFPVISVVLGTVILLLISAVLFSTISTLVWCIVHKQWLSTKEPKDWEKMWNAILNRLKGK